MPYYETIGVISMFMAVAIIGTFKAIFAKNDADRYAAFILITFGILILSGLVITVIIRSNIIVK